jgi:hypothetical protein
MSSERLDRDVATAALVDGGELRSSARCDAGSTSTRELAHPLEARSAVATARRDARDGVGATGARELGTATTAKENGRRRRERRRNLY